MNKINIKEQMFFAKRLSFLLRSGIPLEEALGMIRMQTRKKSYIKILDMVIDDVMNGQNLSTSLARFPKTFGEFSINIISFGEASGILPENLEYISAELTKRSNLKKKIISASIYPIIVTIATICIVTFLMVFLFPKILPIFSSLHYALPISTQIVIFFSKFVIHYGLWLLGLFVAFTIVFVVLLKKSKVFKFLFSKLLLQIPIMGKIIKDYNMANFSRTFGLLLRGGVSMHDAISIVGATTSNVVYKNEFRKLGIVINRGSKISAQLANNRKLFPDIVTQIISSGEHSGNLSESLLYLSQLFEEEVDDFTKNLSSLVEPVLMIIMGLLVGFIAISIITPIYGITQHLQAK